MRPRPSATPLPPAARAVWAAFAALAFLSAFAPASGGEALSLVDAARVVASGQPDAKIEAVGDSLHFVMTNDEKSPFPGIALKPPGDVWDLTDYGYVEATLRNPNDFEVPMFVRVDDNGELLPSGTWLTGQKKIPAGATETVRVYLADLNYGRTYILQRERVPQVLVFGGLKDRAVPMVLVSAVAGGVAGERPDHYIPVLPPENGVLADFAGNGPAVAIGLDGAAAEREAGTGLRMKFTGAGGKDGQVRFNSENARWSLIRYNRATFTLVNPTDRAQTATVALHNWFDGRKDPYLVEGRTVTVPANGRAEAVIAFDDVPVWRSVIQSDGKAKITDRESERVRGSGDLGGSNLNSDDVGGASVSAAAGTELVLVNVVASTGGPDALPAWSGTRPPVEGAWSVTFNDDFDGADLDETKWNKKMQWVGLPPGELSRYHHDNVAVRDGAMRLSVRREPTLYNGQEYHWMTEGQYSAGVASTWGKFSQRYGYFEAKMKLPDVYGVWPAFWAMPWHGPGVEARRRGTRHGGAEIDIFEHLTRFGPYRTNIAVHWDDYGPDHKKTGTSRVYYRPDADGWVVAGLLWEPGKLTWYVNQRVVGVWESPAVPSVAIYPKFTMPVGSWSGYVIDDARLADADFVIDYLRVWQRDDLAALPAPEAIEDPAAQGYAVGAETLVNGHMTEGGERADGWTQVGSGRGKLAAARDTGVVFGPPASLRVHAEGDAEAQGSVSQRVEGLAGFTMKMSGYMKVGPDVKAAGVGIGCFDENWKLLKWIDVYRAPGGEMDWTKFEKSETVPAGTARVNVDLMFTGKGAYWVDDLSLVRVE